MRTCDIAIVGLGLMGSSALHALTRMGADVLGVDPLVVGQARGSSHGSCRVYRRFNFESNAYTDLSTEAYRGWRVLESLTGRVILKPSCVLEAGPPGSKIVAASRDAARKVGPIDGPTNGKEANSCYPAFRLPSDWDVVVQASGGILMAEAALRAFREGAEHRIVRGEARMQPTATDIRISTSDIDIAANQVILAAGPWIGGFIPDLAKHLEITRQVVGWFEPSRPETVRYDALPIFIVQAKRGLIYGFPDFEGRGVKAARHDHGRVVGPDEWGPEASDTELESVSATLTDLLPGAAGPIVERDVCLYTNTRKADVRTDEGEEFVIDRLPSDPRIIVASPCSGHGAKFATAIGEMLARLASDPGYQAPEAFRLNRFSSFSDASTTVPDQAEWE